MDMETIAIFGPILAGLIGIFIGIAVGIYYSTTTQNKKFEERLATAKQTAHEDAKREAALKVAEVEERRARELEAVRAREAEQEALAKEEMLRYREQIDAENRQRRADMQKDQRRLQQKEETLDQKQSVVDRRERVLVTRETENDKIKAEAEAIRNSLLQELERVANLTVLEARQEILAKVEEEARVDAARLIRDIEREAQDEARERVRRIMSLAMARTASSFVAETTVTMVHLPSDDMKGRIIGREGRNIRAFEQATGIDLIVDDTPQSITLSGFDPVRREIAKRALNRLVLDGRIHPARIEEVVEKAKQEVELGVREEGERAAFEANVQGLHPDLVKLLGRLRYRITLGQNELNHALETSWIAATLAAEIGADVNVAKTAALLHNIGKAIDHEVEGSHGVIGAELAKRLGRSPKVVHAIAAHHGEEDPQTSEAWIVQAADMISKNRPGSRRETLSFYIKRMEGLEGVANSFPGVSRSFAVQAGREVRVLVTPGDIDDLAAVRLVRDVAKKIEDSIDYPGQVKVTVIRETRAIDFAK